MAAKIRRDDEVIVLTGKDKGKRGKVKNVLSSGKVIVEGINLVKKHQKPVPALNQPGGIVEKEAAIQVSNVAIFNAATGKADRVGLAAISGQKPLITKARKSVAGFKIRQGYPIGCKVTLRGERMWEFFERLITIAVPRIRDFRGLSAKSFDGRGNYSMGVREQIIFPEIDYDKVDRVRGLDITITTTAKSDEEGRALLAAFDFPFRK